MIKSTLMIQGTTSDAGKSIMVTGLCRVMLRRGVSVAPFKPQNMALNSAVTQDGGEVGRAQALQAQACGLVPHTDMNPILLKPNTDIGAQVIVQGHAIGNMDATHYHDYKKVVREAMLESYRRLSSQYDLVIVEGAGSPAEINLRDRDIANMGFAEAVDCPVWLIADIDRGGVFAHLVGTLALLSPSEQQRISGLIINRFRGDIALLQSGLDWLEQETKKPVLATLPYLQGLHLDAEDAIQQPVKSLQQGALKVVIPVVPRISNHTDFDPLSLHPQVDLQFVRPEQALPPADLIILPGSKSVCHDMAWLKGQGWDRDIQRHLRYGGKLLGICGGFQMLGEAVHDPKAVEGAPGSVAGLGLLEMETTLEPEKQLCNISGQLTLESAPVKGYEIHAGVTTGPALERPLVSLEGRVDGACSGDGQVIGTYLHGLFEAPAACAALLRWAGLEQPISVDHQQIREQGIDRVADAIEACVDASVLDALAAQD